MDIKDSSQSVEEQNVITDLVKSISDIPGDLAEVGVYIGGSEAIIWNAMNKDKTLYLYDTFAGFDYISTQDPQDWASFVNMKDLNWHETVVNKFKDKTNVKVIKGAFPGSVLPVEKYSFVHLDVDAYGQTIAALEYFYPRLSKGAVVILHDYAHANAPIAKACEVFFGGKPEKRLAFNTSQAAFIKQ